MMKVLIADDEKELCDLLSEMIQQKLNVEVDVALDGNQAFEMAQKNQYQIIITDFKMPGLDGGQLIEKIRTTQNLSQYATIFLISGHYDASKHDPTILEKVMFFNKPLELEKLLRYCKFALRQSIKEKVA